MRSFSSLHVLENLYLNSGVNLFSIDFLPVDIHAYKENKMISFSLIYV
jgi:hypothetical protein